MPTGQPSMDKPGGRWESDNEVIAARANAAVAQLNLIFTKKLVANKLPPNDAEIDAKVREIEGILRLIK